ncbi:MAG: ribosome silencing factor [Lachnospiraceae bacterium]|nr:ribosome silencing factor [Lachnospiraceae bacterium]
MTEHNKIQSLAGKAILALEDKKAEDIRIIDISRVSVIADYFIIANGNNVSQIQAMADEVEEKLHKAGCPLRQKEGYANANWVLLDFGDIIIHIFDKENRLFYDLERIWRDGVLIEADELKNIADNDE